MDIPKTPVSILQEIMMKKGVVPNYDLIANGSGTHQNVFTYSVVCGNWRATGSGRCKKDAKHEAADAMLKLISGSCSLPQLPVSPTDSPVRTPLPMKLPVRPKSPLNVPFRNFVGELTEICGQSHLHNPIYEEINDVGPPHARIFTTKCTVSHFSEIGTATTKKQAKHDAAKKMIEKIQSMGIDLSTDEPDIQSSAKVAMARYPELSAPYNEVNKSKANLGLAIKDYYKRFKERFSDKENRDEFLLKVEQLRELLKIPESNLTEEKLELVKIDFQDLMRRNDIEYNCTDLPSTKRNTFLKVIQLYVEPDIVEVGFGPSPIAAEVHSFQKIVDSMKLLLIV